ncbi:MAG: DivIVA domain-containing protein [Bacilli bacterium]|nr:DivIVA domain-containing protein [Bacilli bacterium]
MEKFSYEANGYNRSEVNDFVGEVIKETEGIIARVKSQREEIVELKKELEEYKQKEITLNHAIMKAEETSDNIKKMARQEGELIIADAKSNASRIVNDALIKAEKIEAERDILERNIKIFKRKLKLIMEQQMAVVEEIEVLELDG